MVRAHGRGRKQGGVLSLTLRPVVLTVKSFFYIGVNFARVIGGLWEDAARRRAGSA